jgi:truncated hemoglobin YjbI
MARILPAPWNHLCNDPGIPSESEAMASGIIRSLVEAFYMRVREDEVLEPIFEPVLAARWEHQISRLIEF